MTTIQYHTRKAAGLCPECGKHPPQYGYVLCATCQDIWTMPATRDHMRLVRAALGKQRALPGHPAPLQSQPAPLSPGHPICAVREGDAEASVSNLLGCCGAWHPITALPMRCSSCGRQWLGER